MKYALAYMAPGAAAWAALGLLLWQMHIPVLIWLLVGAVYAAVYGLGRLWPAGIAPPTIRWQVPAQWVIDRRWASTLIWGFVLGPGVLTRNPLAGMWMLPVSLALQTDVQSAVGLGAALGALHGAARATAVMRLQPRLASQRRPELELFASLWRWRMIDGFVLLFALGALCSGLFAFWWVRHPV